MAGRLEGLSEADLTATAHVIGSRFRPKHKRQSQLACCQLCRASRLFEGIGRGCIRFGQAEIEKLKAELEKAWCCRDIDIILGGCFGLG